MKGKGAIWVQRRKPNSAMQRGKKELAHGMWYLGSVLNYESDEEWKNIYYFCKILLDKFGSKLFGHTISPKVSLDTIHIYSRGVNSLQRGRKGVILVLGIVCSKNCLCRVCFSCMTCSFVLLSLKSNSVTCWKQNRASLGLILLLPVHI